MEKPILALIDNSIYRKSVIRLATWASRMLNAPVRLLHVLDKSEPEIVLPQDIAKNIDDRFRGDFVGKIHDSSASYARLMQELGQLILDEAEDYLKKHIHNEVDTRLRYDSLADAIDLYSKTSSIVIIGKGGSLNAEDFENVNVGRNFETIVRASHCPVLTGSQPVRTIKKILILCDEDFEIKTILDYVQHHDLFKRKSCLVVFEKGGLPLQKNNVDEVIETLRNAKIAASPAFIDEKMDGDIINKIIHEHQINLTVLSAFNQSRIKQLIFGSSRDRLIKKIKTPVFITHSEC